MSTILAFFIFIFSPLVCAMNDDLVFVSRPILVFHPQEKYFPTDPTFFLDSKTRSHPQPFNPAPILWKKGSAPILDFLKMGNTEKSFSIVEYWIHYNYNDAEFFLGLGNHEGDWEGIGVLFEHTTGPKTSDKVVAIYFSQHEAGEWVCAKDVEWKAGRPLVYVARGSHASFPHVGDHSRTSWFLGLDHTAVGPASDAWSEVRRLENEPYYTRREPWGRESLIPWNRSPFVPHHSSKFLPRDTTKESLMRMAARLKKSCFSVSN